MVNMSMISAIQVQPEAGMSTIIHAAPTHLGTNASALNEHQAKQNLGAIGTSTFENGVGVLHDDVTRDVGLEVHNPKKYDLSNYQDMPGSPKRSRSRAAVSISTSQLASTRSHSRPLIQAWTRRTTSSSSRR